MSEKLVHRTQVLRMYPTPAQVERLSQWVGTVRFVYNLAWEQRRTFGRPGRRFNYVTQGREITALRAAVDWIADAPRSCLDAALHDLDQAYTNWWSGRAKAPTRRRRGLNDSLRLRARDCRARQVSRRSGRLFVPKLGEVRLRLSRPLATEWKTWTIFRRGDAWFAAGVHEHECAAGGSVEVVGIDRGVRIFAALSSGELIDGLNVGRQAANALARAQRKLSRKKRGSRNRDKQRRRVAKLHARVANARKNFVHRISTDIAKSHGVVVLEQLRVGKMTRSATGTVENPGRNVRQKAGLNRSILDQGWGMFQRLLAYKLADRGGRLVLVPANDTSRTCAACGIVDPESRKAERFNCTACGHTADADINAAINIERRGRASVLPVDGSVLDAPIEAGTGGRAA